MFLFDINFSYYGKKMLKPILLRSFGRSGSTLMMQLLGTSKLVSFRRIAPYEARYLTYLTRTAALLDSEFTPSEDWGHDTINTGGLQRIGPIPFSDTEYFNRHDFSEIYFKSTWNAFSEYISTKEPEAIFYAEKISLKLADAVSNILPCKNIYLIRDPRDEFISIKKFNEKRGSFGFGWTDDDDDLSFAKKHANARRGYLKKLIQLEEDKNNILIRYEDLILQSGKVVDRLSFFLGLRLEWGGVINGIESHKDHMTSDNQEDSIERWKFHMPSDIIEVYQSILAEELLGLQYNIHAAENDKFK